MNVRIAPILRMICTRSRSMAEVATLLAALSPLAQAAGNGQSFESCAMITSEYLTVLQLSARGLGPEALKETLPGISDAARQRVDSLTALARETGMTKSFAMTNAEYAACAREVYQARGMPVAGTREEAFYVCAGENTVRSDILAAFMAGAPLTALTGRHDQRLQETVQSLYERSEKYGVLATFDQLASELKHCISINR